jgi:hypothetical protein
MPDRHAAGAGTTVGRLIDLSWAKASSRALLLPFQEDKIATWQRSRRGCSGRRIDEAFQNIMKSL